MKLYVAFRPILQDDKKYIVLKELAVKIDNFLENKGEK